MHRPSTEPNMPPTAQAKPLRARSSRSNWSDFRDHLATADKEGRRKWLYPKKPRGPVLPGADVADLGAAGGHVRRAVRQDQRQPAADDQYRRAQVLRARRHLLAAGQPGVRAGLPAVPDGHRRVHRRVRPALVRLDLPANRADGDGVPQDRILHRRRCAPRKRPWTARRGRPAKLGKKAAQARHLLRPLLRHRQHAAGLHHRHRRAEADRHGRSRATT